MAVQDQPEESLDRLLAHLFDEIVRYLAAVDTFRAEGPEPAWADDQTLPEWWLEEHFPSRKPEPAEATV
jgi:hypothetical protein